MKGSAFTLPCVLIMLSVSARVLFVDCSRSIDLLHGWPVLDEATYLQNAHELLASGFSIASMKLPFWQPPGYVFILAVLLSLGFKLKAILALQQGLGIISSLLIYQIAKKCLQARPFPAALAGILYSLCPAILYYEIKIQKISWIIFLLLTLLYLLEYRRHTAAVAGTGLVVALLSLVESYFVLLVPICLWTMFRSRIRQASTFLIMAFAPLLPVILLNSLHAGRPMFISYNGGINFFLGNSPQWTETYNTLPGWPWQQLAHRYGVQGPGSEARFAHEVMSFALDKPVVFVRGLFEKALLLFSCRELPRDNLIMFPSGLDIWAQEFNIFLAGLCGLALFAFQKRSRHILCILGLIAGINIFFFPSTRYRLPAVPLLLVGLSIAPLHRRSFAAAAGLAAVGLLAGQAAGHFVDYPAWRSFYQKEVGEKLMQYGQSREAGLHFRAAVEAKFTIEAAQSLAHYVYQIEHEAEAAEALFQKCIELDPAYPEPYYYLGGLDWSNRHDREALQNFTTYIQLRDRWGYLDTDATFLLLRALYCSAAIERNYGDVAAYATHRQRMERIIRSTILKPGNPADSQLLRDIRSLPPGEAGSS